MRFQFWMPTCFPELICSRYDPAEFYSHSSALLHLFISSNTNISSTMAFPPLGNSDHVVVLVSIDSP